MVRAPVLLAAFFILTCSVPPAASLRAQSLSMPSAVEATTSAVERALSTRVNLGFSNVAVEELAADLRGRFRINVMVDQRALDDVGLDGETRLPGLECSQLPLELGLELLLEQVDLYFYVRGDVLMITTPEEAENNLTTVVYPVADLLGDYLDFDTLIATITSAVEPVTWEQVGGAGAIEPFPASRVLVISQTRRVHRKVRELLAQLRQAGTSQPVAQHAPSGLGMSESWPTRAKRDQLVSPSYRYRPGASWSLPRRHD